MLSGRSIVWDVQSFYEKHADKCPNCGVDLKSLHPQADLYVHYTGACKSKREQP